MSLLKRKLEKDRKAAEEAARLAEEKKLQDLATHPMFKDGSGRDLRDAYFYGLVFAAFANDDQLEEEERAILNDVGASLGMSSSDIEETIAHVQTLSDDGKFALVEECVKALKGNETAVKLFYAQFVQIWSGSDYMELTEYLQTFTEWTGTVLPKSILLNIRRQLRTYEGKDTDENLYVLSEWMGEVALKYFVVKQYGDITKRLAKIRKEKAALEKKKQAEADGAERARQNTALNDIIDEVVIVYGSHDSLVLQNLKDIKEQVKGIDPDKIDWAGFLGTDGAQFDGSASTGRAVAVNVVLGPFLGPVVNRCLDSRSAASARRQYVWRLITLLMLVCPPEMSPLGWKLDRLLGTCGSDEKEKWGERLTAVIEKYLGDRLKGAKLSARKI